MNKDYWFPWSPARFRADTMHLTAEQDGIYRRLIDHYMETGLPLMENDHALARIAGVSLDIWAGVSGVIKAFFNERNGKLHSKRCDEILIDQNDRSVKNLAKSQHGAASRWGDGDKPKLTRSQRLAEARTKGTHNNGEWMALLEVCGYVCCKCRQEAPLVKDHIIPIYQGGSDGIENIQPLCRSCNSAKGADKTDLRPLGWRKCLQNACQTPAIGQDTTGQESKKDPVDDRSGNVSTTFVWLERFFNSTSPLVMAPVAAWFAWGADFELDIKPVAQRWRKQNPKKTIRSLEWLDDDIAASIRKRAKPMPQENSDTKGLSYGGSDQKPKPNSVDKRLAALYRAGTGHGDEEPVESCPGGGTVLVG